MRAAFWDYPVHLPTSRLEKETMNTLQTQSYASFSYPFSLNEKVLKEAIETLELTINEFQS